MLGSEDELEHYRRLDREASTHVGFQIVTRTDFDGSDPGWAGLGRALGRALDERDALRAKVKKLEGSR